MTVMLAICGSRTFQGIVEVDHVQMPAQEALALEVLSRWTVIEGIYVGGRGKKYPCPKCQGQGIITLEEIHARLPVTCPHCKGSAWQPQVGAAALAKKFGDENDIFVHIVPPDWVRYGGKPAGPRNHPNIIVPCNAVIAFWDGHSPGTRGEIACAKELHKPLVEIRFKPLGGIIHGS